MGQFCLYILPEVAKFALKPAGLSMPVMAGSLPVCGFMTLGVPVMAAWWYDYLNVRHGIFAPVICRAPINLDPGTSLLCKGES